MNKILKMPAAIKKVLAKRDKKKQLKWNGSKIDLMELVYALYLSEQLKTPSGHTATLQEITMTVFNLFGLDAPQNPSRVVSGLKQRVDQVNLSVFCQALSYLYPDFIKCLKK